MLFGGAKREFLFGNLNAINAIMKINPVQKRFLSKGKGTGCSRSGVIFFLKRDSGRKKIRSERSRDRRSERSEGNMPSPCLSI